MEDIYYVDRPSIPATQQVIVKMDSILEHAVQIDTADINPGYCGYAVEVRDHNGDVDGTLVYFPGISYAQLTSADDVEDYDVFADEPVATYGVAAEAESDEPAVVESEQDSLDSWTAVEGAGSTDVEVLNSIRENRVLNLELELAAAKQLVQDLEDELADEEGAID